MYLTQQPLTATQACSVQPLEDYDEPRAPLMRQVSLDEERLCPGHWKPKSADTFEAAHSVRLLRHLILDYCTEAGMELPRCAQSEAEPDTRSWWHHWRDTQCLIRASQRFRESDSYKELRERAEQVELAALDRIEFDDIMQELCQDCPSLEERALVVFNFLCMVCIRSIGAADKESLGGWCRTCDWAANHVATVTTPWAIRHGGWSAVIYRESRSGGSLVKSEERALIAAGAAAIIAILFYCRIKLRASVH